VPRRKRARMERNTYSERLRFMGICRNRNRFPLEHKLKNVNSPTPTSLPMAVKTPDLRAVKGKPAILG
jgi:hypothetical protein